MSDFSGAVDLAVVPSCGPEVFGRMVIEAMAMQRPVIAIRSGGPEEIIKANETGLLVPMGDSGALAVAVSELLEDAEARSRIGAAGRLEVERHFSATAYAGRVMELYDRILGVSSR